MSYHEIIDAAVAAYGPARARVLRRLRDNVIALWMGTNGTHANIAASPHTHLYEYGVDSGTWQSVGAYSQYVPAWAAPPGRYTRYLLNCHIEAETLGVTTRHIAKARLKSGSVYSNEITVTANGTLTTTNTDGAMLIDLTGETGDANNPITIEVYGEVSGPTPPPALFGRSTWAFLTTEMGIVGVEDA